MARDFKEFIRIVGMTHVRTSPGYPQSNGKLERWHKSLKSVVAFGQAHRLTREDALRLIQTYVDYYRRCTLAQRHRLCDAARYARRATAEIHAARDRKLEEARHHGSSGGRQDRCLHILRTRLQ